MHRFFNLNGSLRVNPSIHCSRETCTFAPGIGFLFSRPWRVNIFRTRFGSLGTNELVKVWVLCVQIAAKVLLPLLIGNPGVATTSKDACVS
jgi:hypothetical protein